VAGQVVFVVVGEEMADGGSSGILEFLEIK
jgi:hypothetical protein